MGIVFGITGSAEPAYEVKKSSPYEIRVYEPCFVAETTGDSPNDTFRRLAKYIGAFGDAENYIGSAAGILEERRSAKIAMTAPVLSGTSTMQFILPKEFTQISEIPVPNDPNVTIRQIPGRTVAVLTYSGWNNVDLEKVKYQTLSDLLHKDGLLNDKKNDKTDAGNAPNGDSQEAPYQVAQYQPPFTLPWFRRNEVWVTLNQ